MPPVMEKKDFLTQDDPIRGQNYVCMSFLCPDQILDKKEVFTFSRFMSDVTMHLSQLLDHLRTKYPDDQSHIDHFRDSHDFLFSEAAMQEQYRSFLNVHGPALDDEFHKQNEFQTSMRGIKIRGVYSTIDEAKHRCTVLHAKDPLHHIWVGEVGTWLPFTNNPSELNPSTQDTLNELKRRYDGKRAEEDSAFAQRNTYGGRPF